MPSFTKTTPGGRTYRYPDVCRIYSPMQPCMHARTHARTHACTPCIKEATPLIFPAIFTAPSYAWLCILLMSNPSCSTFFAMSAHVTLEEHKRVSKNSSRILCFSSIFQDKAQLLLLCLCRQMRLQSHIAVILISVGQRYGDCFSVRYSALHRE